MAVGLQISGGEQTLVIDRWRAVLRYNFVAGFWFYDLYFGSDLLLAGQKLTVNSYPGYQEWLPYPKLFLIDTDPTNTQPIDMLNDFGSRLELSMTDYAED